MHRLGHVGNCRHSLFRPLCLVGCLPRSQTVHRMLLTCLMLTAKFYDDVHTTNAFYARMGGVTLQELNELEVSVLLIGEFPQLDNGRDPQPLDKDIAQTRRNTTHSRTLDINKHAPTTPARVSPVWTSSVSRGLGIGIRCQWSAE